MLFLNSKEQSEQLTLNYFSVKTSHEQYFLMLPMQIKTPAFEKNKLVSGVTAGTEKLIQKAYYQLKISQHIIFSLYMQEHSPKV